MPGQFSISANESTLTLTGELPTTINPNWPALLNQYPYVTLDGRAPVDCLVLIAQNLRPGGILQLAPQTSQKNIIVALQHQKKDTCHLSEKLRIGLPERANSC